MLLTITTIFFIVIYNRVSRMPHYREIRVYQSLGLILIAIREKAYKCMQTTSTRFTNGYSFTDLRLRTTESAARVIWNSCAL